MPIQLDNAQYKAFVSFAQGANDENAIAHAGSAAPADPLAGGPSRPGRVTRSTPSPARPTRGRPTTRRGTFSARPSPRSSAARNGFPHDVRKALRGMIRNDLLLEANKLSGYMARIGAAGIGVDLVRGSVLEVMAAVPELKAELRACKRAEDFEAVFEKRGPAIEAHMHIMAEAARVKARSEDMLVEEFVKATGRDEAFFRENIPLAKFRSDVAGDIRDKIANGKIPVTSSRQVEAAFRDAARAYVSEHLAAAGQADGLANVSDAVRRSLRHGAIVVQDAKSFKIAKYAPLATQLDVGPLREIALRKPFSVAHVAPVLRATAKALADIGETHCGSGAWGLMGVDGQQPFANIVFKCALSGEPELAKILGEHSEELMNETSLLIPPKEDGTMSMLVGAMPAVRELAAEL